MSNGMAYQETYDPVAAQAQFTKERIGGSPEQTRAQGGIHPLEPQEIVAAVEKEMVDALGAYGSSIHEQRRINLRRYHGKPFGNEQAGQSQAQIMQVADTVEWMMPPIMRAIFGAGTNIWDYDPTRPDQEEYAEQASDAINHVFVNQLDGFLTIHDLAKTALIEKRSYAAVYWEERNEPKRSTYRGISEQMVGLITQDPNVELIEFGPHTGEQQIDPMTGMPAEIFDITIVQTGTRGRIRVESIAPEHMLLSRREPRLDDDTRFSGYRKRTSVGDLIALGYPPDIVSLLPGEDRPEFIEGRIERLYDEDAWPLNRHRGDGASREIWINYIYLKIDEDGDGYAELREIVCTGQTSIVILSDKVVNHNPLVSLCPILMPHKFHGLCPADQAVDNQVITSTILRQLLDNQYRMNNARHEVVEGEVNIDDLMANLPGGAVRVSAPGMIAPLITPPLPQGSFELLSFMQGVNEKRTGVSQWQQGPDAGDMKYQTRGAVSNVQTASESKINLINMVFANTGLKRLGRLLLQTMCENYAGPFVYRLRGRWMECDPRSWDADMDCTVRTGLGVGEMEAKTQQLMLVAEAQQKMLENGLRHMVTPRNLYATVKELVKNFDLGFEGKFFTDPGPDPWPQPEPELADQVKVMESQRRTAEDQATAAHNTMALAVQASGQEGMASFRREELAVKTEVDVLEMANSKQIAELQIAGQIQAAMQHSQNRRAA